MDRQNGQIEGWNDEQTNEYLKSTFNNPTVVNFTV